MYSCNTEESAAGHGTKGVSHEGFKTWNKASNLSACFFEMDILYQITAWQFQDALKRSKTFLVLKVLSREQLIVYLNVFS